MELEARQGFVDAPFRTGGGGRVRWSSSFVVLILLLGEVRVCQHSEPHDERGFHLLCPSPAPAAVDAEPVQSAGSFARKRHSRSFIACASSSSGAKDFTERRR